MATSSPAIEELYSDAINPDHPYRSTPSLAQSLLSTVTDALQLFPYLPGLAHVQDQAAVTLAISYIHFEAACTTPFKPHTTMAVMQVLRNTFEKEVELSQEPDFSHAHEFFSVERMLKRHADVVLPWLWRASHNGIESHFVQNTVFLGRCS
jgi:hypothetical protein